MLSRSHVSLHRSGKARAFVFRDPSLRLLRAGSGIQQLKRMGMSSQTTTGYRKVDDFYANNQYQHAWPLLSHDDLGNSDQSNQTKNILYSMYMPKRNKGTAPWFRGADTYSVKYSEQGRFEYQRYLMINRFPSEYKMHFLRFLNNIRGAGAAVALPQEALHWLLRMIVDNFNPQHVHYIAAMQTLLNAGEVDMARDVWKIMERQQTWPDTRTLCSYLDVCLAGNEPTWAIEAWNRYATELRFLQYGEVDPKPVSRIPFSLTREELLYLPKWKKHFDHDPNLDVPDLNRFNRSREVYLRMAKVMLRSGTEMSLFEHFFQTLVEAMRDTPTPIPEPPNPLMIRRPRWQPYEHLPSTHASPWRVQNNARMSALGPRTVAESARIGGGDVEMDSRFFSNAQFLVHSIRECIEVLQEGWLASFPPDNMEEHEKGTTEIPIAAVITRRRKGGREEESDGVEDGRVSNTPPPHGGAGASPPSPSFFRTSPEELLEFVETKLLGQLRHTLAEMHSSTSSSGGEHPAPAGVNHKALLSTYLELYRVVGKASGEELLQKAHDFTLNIENSIETSSSSSSFLPPVRVKEALSASHYLQIIKGLADESSFVLVKPKKTMFPPPSMQPPSPSMQDKGNTRMGYDSNNANTGSKCTIADDRSTSLLLETSKWISTSTRDPAVSPTGYRYLHPNFSPKAVMEQLTLVLREIQSNPHITWSADMHLAVVRVLVNCGTMKANEYFVRNVLRQFQWPCTFLEVLYLEYRRHADVDLWAELTKRALVWTARYDVLVTEKLKRLIEDDYAYIGVHTRTFRELAVFQFRDLEEKRHASRITSALPNPWVDFVSHALPFPDRDAGYPDEYGDIGQWRAPGGPGSPVKGPGYYAPAMEGEHLRGYTAEWRDLKNPMRPPTFPDPWEKKYAQYARGQHPSYDMVYAGPMPEIFPERYNFRKPTRWDFHDIEKQGKFKISGPY